jgi:hypothetical protein
MSPRPESCRLYAKSGRDLSRNANILLQDCEAQAHVAPSQYDECAISPCGEKMPKNNQTRHPPWHAAHAGAPADWCPGPKPRGAPRNPITLDMVKGDTPACLDARLAWMAASVRRRASMRTVVEDLHAKLRRMMLEEAMDPGDGSTTPRMRVRHVHDAVIGKARHMHCHAGIYRSTGAMKRLAAGGLYRPGTAIVHFEHTIPGVVVLPMLWQLVQDGTLSCPRELLAWMLHNMVVTVLDITERDTTLNARRIILGHESSWTAEHPDLPKGAIIIDNTRPFLRYAGTGLAVFDYRTGLQIDLQHDCIRDHRKRMANVSIYDAALYFD